MKKKETDEEANKSKQDDDEVNVSKNNLNREQKDDDEREKEALNFTDSFHPQDSNLTSVQAMDKAEERELDGSTQESHERLEVEGTKQGIEDHFDGKEAGENGEKEGSGKKKTPRRGKLWSWWRKMWQASGDLQSAVQQEKENDPRTEPD